MRVVDKYLSKIFDLNFVLSGIINGLIAATGSLLIVSFIFFILSALAIDFNFSITSYDASLDVALGLIIFAPLIETFLLSFLVKFLMRYNLSVNKISLLSALIFGLLHSLQSPVRFFGTVWSFFIFSRCILFWWEESFKKALFATFLPHAILNLIVFSAISLNL